MTSIPVGPATSIIQNIVYALPGKATFLTSNDEVETSLDQLTWTSQAESVTGMITGSKFVRCTTTDSIIVCSNIVIESGGGGGSNPFNQDLNTTDSPQFVELTMMSHINLNPDGSSQIRLQGTPEQVILQFDPTGFVQLTAGPATLTFDGVNNIIQSDVDLGNSFVPFRSGYFSGSVSATDFIATTNPGINTSITTGGLVGKTITVVNGRITAFA